MDISRALKTNPPRLRTLTLLLLTSSTRSTHASGLLTLALAVAMVHFREGVLYGLQHPACLPVKRRRSAPTAHWKGIEAVIMDRIYEADSRHESLGL